MQEYLFYQDKKHLIPEQKPIFANSKTNDNLDESSTDGSVLSTQDQKTPQMSKTGSRFMAKGRYKSDLGIDSKNLV